MYALLQVIFDTSIKSLWYKTVVLYMLLSNHYLNHASLCDWLVIKAHLQPPQSNPPFVQVISFLQNCFCFMHDHELFWGDTTVPVIKTCAPVLYRKLTYKCELARDWYWCSTRIFSINSFKTRFYIYAQFMYYQNKRFGLISNSGWVLSPRTI